MTDDSYNYRHVGADCAKETDFSIVYGTPESFGWLRRPECDPDKEHITYEKPDGTLQVFQKNKRIFLARQLIKDLQQ